MSVISWIWKKDWKKTSPSIIKINSILHVETYGLNPQGTVNLNHCKGKQMYSVTKEVDGDIAKKIPEPSGYNLDKTT